jgi:hypothetical protein
MWILYFLFMPSVYGGTNHSATKFVLDNNPWFLYFESEFHFIQKGDL